MNQNEEAKTFVTRKISIGVSKIILGQIKTLKLGNLEAKRDWGYAPEYVEGMWRMLQADKPDDFVLATGKSHTVRDFINESFNVLGDSIIWEGEGVNEKGILQSSGNVVIEINPKYFRPTEVEILLGDSSKAYEILDWKAETDFKNLVRIMTEYDYNRLKDL